MLCLRCQRLILEDEDAANAAHDAQRAREETVTEPYSAAEYNRIEEAYAHGEVPES